jgi:hypothetical protein
MKYFVFEGRRQKAEGRRQKAEGRRQKADKICDNIFNDPSLHMYKCRFSRKTTT